MEERRGTHGEGVRVSEADTDGTVTFGKELVQALGDRGFVQRRNHSDKLAGKASDELFVGLEFRPLDDNSLIDLDDLLVQDVGLLNRELEEVRPGLIANGDEVAEALRLRDSNNVRKASRQGSEVNAR